MSFVPDQQTKNTHPSHPVLASEQKECDLCQRCIAVCPARLEPHRLWFSAIANNPRKFSEDDIAACLLCGCCQYACPAGLPLVKTFIRAKRRIANAKKE